MIYYTSVNDSWIIYIYFTYLLSIGSMGYIDGIHVTIYIAAPWIRHGL